jgi:mannose-6-phosphate isomerase-like protein (cupin superfamily)
MHTSPNTWRALSDAEDIGLAPVVLGPGEGTPVRANQINDDLIHIKTDGRRSNGLLTVLEYHGVPHSPGVEPHIHSSHEEGFYVIRGELSLLLGEERVVLQQGGWGFVPRNVLHAFWNDSDEECAFLATFSPSGFERIFFERVRLAAEGTPTPEALSALARQHGVTPVGWDGLGLKP